MTTSPPQPSLQDRRAALARDAILDALVTHLEAGDIDSVGMEDLAREAGVSRRTLYRYFPTRTELIAAGGDWVRGKVFKIEPGIGEGGIAASFRAGTERMQTRPRLARALLRTESGRAVRGSFRAARVDAIRRDVRARAPALTRRETDRAAAILSYLCSLNAWVGLQEESGLSPERAEEAVLWAIDLIQNEITRDNRKRTPR
jgi:AcrR family transcriptional regulator